MDNRNVAVLGGGAIAAATSAELTSSGFKVNLFELPRFKENVQVFKEKGGVEFSGVLGSGFAKLNMVTTNIQQAVKNVCLIILTSPAFAHQTFVEACAPYLQDGQIFLIETAYFGCLRFAKTIRDTGKQVVIAEINHTPYTCTRTGPARIYIDAKRKEMFVAALPAKETSKVRDLLKNVYPGMTIVPNVLQTSLDNVNWIAHPPITLVHRGLLERTKEYSLPLKDSLSPSAINLMNRMDEERLTLGKAFGLKLLPIKHTYELGGDTLEQALRRSTEFKTFSFEYKNGTNQYLQEDLYYGLPPVTSLADLAKVSIPTIKAVIHLFSVIDGIDYLREGVNAEKMGLAGLGIEEILKFAEEGWGRSPV